MAPLIYILYNANASIFGKLDYARRKFSCAPDESACSACDLTHGGLRLKESEQWTMTKKRIQAEVKELHKDEMDQELTRYVSEHQLTHPLVLGRPSSTEGLQCLLTAEDLLKCSKDHELFLKMLREKATAKGIDVSVIPA
ncbi:MAG: hypothetical protein M1817_006122 [Caeruleum heppii]|nr:MAG: hypothetical protein M1817_006122 [Caeruleum heppii]